MTEYECKLKCEEVMLDKWRILDNPCLCHSINYECTEVKGLCVILECLDCGRWSVLNEGNNNIQAWYNNGEVYFCEDDSQWPLFVLNNKTNEIIQKKGMSWLDKKIIPKRVFVMRNIDIEKHYLSIIKKHKEAIVHWKQKLKDIKCKSK